jgi:hypothetical protein
MVEGVRGKGVLLPEPQRKDFCILLVLSYMYIWVEGLEVRN